MLFIIRQQIRYHYQVDCQKIAKLIVRHFAYFNQFISQLFYKSYTCKERGENETINILSDKGDI